MGPPPLPHGRYQGRIKTFNSKQGFGFVDSPATYDQHRRDVFIHRKQMGDLTVGAEITFEIKMNKDDHPQAREIRRMDGSSPGPYLGGDDDDDRGGEPKKKGRGKGRRNKGGDKDDRGKGKGKGD